MTRPSINELKDEVYLKEVNEKAISAKKRNMNIMIMSLAIVIAIFFGLFFILGVEYYEVLLIIGVSTTIIIYFLQSLINFLFITFQISATSEYYEKHNLYYLEEISAKLDLINMKK